MFKILESEEENFDPSALMKCEKMFWKLIDEIKIVQKLI